MTPSRFLKWTAGLLLAPLVLAVLFIAIFGWNWLRAPIERMTLEKTGRALTIGGDLRLKFGWPLQHIQAGAVSFANPSWAREEQMIAANAVEIAIDLPQLLLGKIVLPEVRLERPIVFLEQASGGRKNWLLDRNQHEDGERFRIDRLRLDNGRLGYDDAEHKTSIRAEVSNSDSLPGGTGIVFAAQGQYQGLPLKARGHGGAVLGLRDERTPYPLNAEFSVGQTGVKVDGTITSLLKFSAVDVRLAVHGENAAQLFPLLGIAFPKTGAYATDGHLVHGGRAWRYEGFSGRIGHSDIAGTLEITTGGKRPAMKADLVSRLLDFADLAPLIGARPAGVRNPKAASTSPAQTAAPAQGRVLPDLPFNTDRWNSVDAEVSLTAKAVKRAKALPIEDLVVHLSLRDSVLRLDPLDFGLAGGHLNAVISLDGREDPIRANARVRARKILIGKLFPTIELSKTSLGQLNGEFDLTGSGNSVGTMLAGSNGKLGLVVENGQISKLMMEKVGLHLWEILVLTMGSDELVKLRCGVADFDVKDGTMRANALILDTEVTTVLGSGSIDLRRENLDLTLVQKTKNTSPIALRPPIHVSGSFSHPNMALDRASLARRGLGALALGLINPLLALIPLIEAGPGKDSDCGKLVLEASAPVPSKHKRTGL